MFEISSFFDVFTELSIDGGRHGLPSLRCRCSCDTSGQPE
jgi:hypothetical protein